MAMESDINNAAGDLDMTKAEAALDKFEHDSKQEETTRRDEKPRDDEAAEPEIEPAGEDWVSAEDIQELVESLGYSDDDLAEFGNRDEFERHVRLMDRQFVKAGKEAAERVRPGDEQQRALEADEEARKRDTQRQRSAEQPREKGRFTKPAEEDLPKLDPEEFDERLVKVLEARDERIRRLEERLSSISALESQAQKQAFDTLVDQLGHDDLFGSSDKQTIEQRKSRARLQEAAEILSAGLKAFGRPVNGQSKALLVRALNQEFAEQLSKKQRQSFNSRVRSQAARRYGGGNQRATGKLFQGPPEKDPELLAAYRTMEAENG